MEEEEEEEDGWEEYDQILDEPELRDVESMQPDHSNNKTRGNILCVGFIKGNFF